MSNQLALGIAARIPSLAGTADGDRSGLRPLLRGRFAHPVAAIEMAILFAAAALSLGQPRLFMILFAVVAISVVVELVLIRAGHAIATDVRFWLWLAAYPIAFVILGAAGWSQATGGYHGESVALIALVAAGFVGLVEAFWFSLVWSSVSTAAMVLGIGMVGAVTSESLIATAAIFVGAAFGASLRRVLEDYLGHRRGLIEEIRHLRPSDDPYVVAGVIVRSLVRWTRIRNATLTWFTDDGRSILLGVAGEELPPALQARRALPEARDAYLRANATNGPWMTGWVVRDTDSGYARDVAATGVTAAAYLPIQYEERQLGILGFAISDATGGRSALIEQFPLFAEVADLSGTKLGPVLARFAALSTASTLLDTILRERAFSPVFQPIRNLATERILGYEALTRFESSVPTESLFLQADALGRLRELELATLEVAIGASAALPPGCWLSLNVSPELLIDTDVLGPLLQRAQRPIVLEISEHVAIAEYAPVAAALDRLGPKCTLAVDDAGAGFASLRHILEIKPEHVKLDLRIVQGVADDATRRALVAGFAHFARDAGFSLIAEGIETQEDLDTLQRLDVTLGQGYLLGRPQPVAEAANLAVA